jgi:GNAT superfamily N-acetyltransferase
MEDVELRDASRIAVRPVEPADRGRLDRAFHRLSPESRYRRFFAPLTELSERDLSYLTEIDHHDHEALAAVDPATDEIVGVARYVRGEEPHLAEASIVVADDWQGRGVATALLERLAPLGAAGRHHPFRRPGPEREPRRDRAVPALRADGGAPPQPLRASRAPDRASRRRRDQRHRPGASAARRRQGTGDDEPLAGARGADPAVQGPRP